MSFVNLSIASEMEDKRDGPDKRTIAHPLIEKVVVQCNYSCYKDLMVLEVWNLDTRSKLWELTLPKFRSRNGDNFNVIISNDGSLLALVNFEKAFIVSFSKKALVNEFSFHADNKIFESFGEPIAFSSQNKFLLCKKYDQDQNDVMIVYDIEKKKECKIMSLSVPDEHVDSDMVVEYTSSNNCDVISASPIDNNLFLWKCSLTQTIQLWNLENESLQKVFVYGEEREFTDQSKVCFFLPDGKKFVGCVNTKLMLWNLDEKLPIREFYHGDRKEGLDHGISGKEMYAITAMPCHDGQYLITTLYDELFLWSLEGLLITNRSVNLDHFEAFVPENELDDCNECGSVETIDGVSMRRATMHSIKRSTLSADGTVIIQGLEYFNGDNEEDEGTVFDTWITLVYQIPSLICSLDKSISTMLLSEKQRCNVAEDHFNNYEFVDEEIGTDFYLVGTKRILAQ